MDTLRPDFLSCYGYPRETSPNIDRLALEGVLFTNAFAQSTWTRSSAASLLSSTYPSVHGVFSVKDVYPDCLPTLSERLKKGGVRSIAISTMGHISKDLGFGNGFESFVELFKDQMLMEKRAKLDVRRGDRKHSWIVESDYVPICTSEDINQVLFPLLNENGEANLFIFVWSIDTHNPYFHRDPNMARSCAPSDAVWLNRELANMRSDREIQRLKTLYEDMIYYNDYHIGALIRQLKNVNLFEQTLFILTGDHGESFHEHGIMGHRAVPYDELIRIPLIMKFPRSQFIGRIDDLVQHIDLAPTILEYFNMPGKDMYIQGKSLLPLLMRQEKVNEFVFAEFQRNEKLPKYTALRTVDYKYIEAKSGKFTIKRSIVQTIKALVKSVIKQRYLFSLKEAGEKVNIIRQEMKKANHFQDQMKAILRDNARISRTVKNVKRGEIEVDQEVSKQLRALGYFD
jgi:arylsulfatase A-like enzyme